MLDDTDRNTGEGPAAAGTQGASPPPPRPPLRRRKDDRIIAGVASGLAAYLNVDPAVVRIAFVVLLFANGVGLPLYIAAAVLMPAADEREAAAHELVRSKGPGFWIGIGILVLVAFAVADALSFGRGNWWPLVLIAAGFALWRAGQRPPAAPPAAVAPSAADAPTASAPTSQETPMTPDTTWTTPSPDERRRRVDFTPPPVPSRAPGPLGRVTVALALIAAGVAVLLDRAGVVDAHLGHVLAAPLVVVGLGLVVGSWFGRARALIVPGLVLVPLVVGAALFDAGDVPWDAGFGERHVRVEDASDVTADGYRLTAGQLTLELDEIARDSGDVEIVAEVGAGEIDVLVPSDATVRVRARANAGDIRLFDRHTTGVGELDETLVRQGDPGAPTIFLDLRVTVGQVTVRDGAATTQES